ncbi:MAG TPA: bifunctional UDP-N-acetylglucosamine diphosphorylase/glucosamine-1-phosphate N-acetyltransferase GlmU [Alphaproteobacteria bacterium]|nr:bifunctional UDP-N-acetylglucosamine diphosphorylase/glucosamine-1-phosphate N-acetyltransferase GlmU [Alphaproteobacteria bacterium]
MKSTPLAIVILAAGKGTRMKSPLPKVMHELAGMPIISLLIQQVSTLNPKKIIVVTAPDQHDLRDLVKPHESVIQQKQLGTGDAARAALPALKGFKGNVLILLGDEPLVPLNVLEEMAAHDHPSVMAIIPDSPYGLGRIVTDQRGALDAIVEEKDCTDEEREILICNGGNFCISSNDLERWLGKLDDKNAQKEFYLTDIAKIAAGEGKKLDVFTIPIDHAWGINDRAQLAEHEKIIQKMLREKFLREGVGMVDADTVYFQFDTEVGAGSFIEPNVFFGPGVVVEDGVHIKAFSHIEGARIGKNSTVGPFARLRPGADVGTDVKIGNFVEIKKSTIGDGSKISHLAYVGDTVMGKDVNFSCGAITVNYDGFDKFETVIGDGAMVGSNVSLVAPVSIGEGAVVAAGSTITEDVQADALAVARSRGETKPGWAKEFRSKKEKR